MAIRREAGFGDLLRRYRKRAGLTQEQLAERAGLSVRGISDLERGINLAPYRSTVVRLADALNLSDDDRGLLEQVSTRFGREMPRVPAGMDRRQQPALLGRERELEVLRRWVCGELPPLLAIAGEPGIGKTRLLQAASELAHERGVAVLRAGCQRPNFEQPYAPLGDALWAYIQDLSAPETRSALKGCGRLSRLVPELTEIEGSPHLVEDLSADAEHRLLTAAVTRFFQNIAGPQGVALVLDDLQWAGRDALQLLLSLCRSGQDTELRIICAYRSTEIAAGSPLSTLLADAAHAGLVERIDPSPLRAHDAERLIDLLVPDGVTAETREQVLIRAGGIPFFLVSCASALHTADAAGPAVPWTVAQSVRQRIGSLPNIAQEVLAVAAIAGRTVPASILMAVMDDLPPVIAGGIDAACRAGLLTEHDGAMYVFTHDVIREVVEMDLGSARRLYLHRAVGDALERRLGGDAARRAAELAWHFAHADDPERALPYALRAGNHAAAMYAHRDAIELYVSAAHYASAIADESAEAEASEKAGREWTKVAEYGTAVSWLDRAAALYRELGDIEAEAHVVAQLAWTHFFRATPGEMEARVVALTEQLGDQERSRGLAELLIALTVLWYADRPNDALCAARRACGIAAKLNDERLLADARIRRGLALWRLGQWEQAENDLTEAAALVEQTGNLETRAQALTFAGTACLMQGKFETARAYYQQGADAAERLGDPTIIGYGLRTLADSHFLLGEWRQARVTLEQARSIDVTVAPSTFSALIPLQMLELTLAEGRWAEVDGLVEACREREHRQRNDRTDTNLLCLLAEYDLLQGRPKAALTRLAPRLEGFYDDETVNFRARTTAIEVCLAVGNTETATALLARYEGLVRAQRNRYLEPHLRRVRGMVRAATGELEAAEEEFAAGDEIAAQLHYPLARARVLLEWARACRDAGETESARGRAHEAELIFHRLGAKPYGDEATRLLATLDRSA